MKENYKYMNVKDLKPAKNNPRKINTLQMDKLITSIQDNPDYFEARPVIVSNRTGENIIIAGNQRLAAAKRMDMEQIPTYTIEGLTESREKEIMVRDNISNGDWDYEILIDKLEWNKEELDKWGVSMKKMEKAQAATLARMGILFNKYIVPPYSILDTRQGYWQERKKEWKALLYKYVDEGATREGVQQHGDSYPTSGRNVRTSQYVPSANTGGASIFDPVLAEIINLWFGFDGCKTFDPFAGGTFGFVSSYLGNKFTGIELRQEQTDVNNLCISDYNQSKYICDDGMNIDKHLEPNSQDLLFSCPPYFNLEVYSDKENDASNVDTYEDFLEIMETAFTKSINILKDNRFAVVVVGNIRDKKGHYIRLCDDIKDIFEKNGMPMYNEMIVIEALGSQSLRADRTMNNRKVAKAHQNALVFYKGNPDNVLVFFKGDNKKIKEIYPKMNIQTYDLTPNTDDELIGDDPYKNK